MSIKKFFLLLTFCSFCCTKAISQAAPSPFSTFGIGEPYGNALINSQGMAGVGIANPEYWFINSQNPALLVFNSMTTFEAGILYESKMVKSDTLSQKSTGGNLSYLVIAFPIRPKDVLKQQKWTTSVGLTPYTNVNYLLQYDDQIAGSDNTATVTESGDGGLSQVYWANGYRLKRNLAVGLQAAYIFGSINKDYRNSLNDVPQTYPYIIEVSEQTYVRDFNFKGGVFYALDSLAKKKSLSFGLTYEFGGHLNASNTTTFSRKSASNTIIDSVTLTSSRRKLFVPGALGLGIAYSKGMDWTIALDFTYRDWSNFKGSTEEESNLEASWKLATGVEFTPDASATEGFFKRLTYRVGLSYEKAPFLANSSPVKDFGINFGMSVPTGSSSMDLAFRIGKRGNKSENLLEESYFKVYFGLTLNERWFIKRKFD